jgi:Ca-activated chloride channel family protein
MMRLLRRYQQTLWLVPLLGLLAVVLQRRTTAFARPEALAGLIMVSALVVLLWYDARWRETARRRFAAVALLQRMGEPPLAPVLLARGLMVTAALVLLVLAAARPKGGLSETTLTSRGIDLCLCLDVSNSMRARDMGGVARLDVAKQFLRSFIERNPGHRIALVAFAGSAHVMCPFTLDSATLETFLDDLDPGSVAEQGTAVGAALRVATERFDPASEGGRAMLLVTDGEDQGSEPLGAAKEAKRRGIVVHTIGLGSSGGSTIPMGTDFWGNPLTKRFQGTDVITHLDEQTLRQIAEATGGRYFYADSQRRLEDVRDALANLDTKLVASQHVETREEEFTWYLLPALLLLAAEPLLRLRRRRAAAVLAAKESA